MFGIGGQELVLLMIIGLIVLGPERLPRIANQIGSWLGQARRMTRVMKRQLEEELDINKPPTIQPPPSREPSFQPTPKPESESKQTPEAPEEPDYVLPRDDDEYSPAHGEDDPGTGVGDEPVAELTDAEKVSAAEAERAAVEEAATSDDPAEKKEAS